MAERHYKVSMDVGDSRIKVNVFTPGQVSNEELEPLAIKRGIEFMKELGQDVAADEVKLIGYEDCGVWP